MDSKPNGSSMAEPARRSHSQSAEMGLAAPNSRQTAQYTQELLDSLRRMAMSQNEEMLALLLKAASLEARRIAGQKS
ncbi:MAG TPA: hypothetical protein VG867_02750 [Rhizomicrobium sp.]|nr:hypothetical protein [Rhizomicrobium sp.]